MGMSQPDGPTYTTVNDTEWITGYALFVTRAGFEQVGLFDERFFLLFEDSDWSLRARRLGYRLRYVGTAQLWHRASVSFGGNHSPLYHYYFTRNKLLWLERHYPLHQFLWLAARFCAIPGRVRIELLIQPKPGAPAGEPFYGVCAII